MECVSECPHTLLDPVRSLSVQVKASKRATKVLENDHLTIRGVKTILFHLCRSPAKFGGPMRGLKDGAVARKPVQHFLILSVVRLKTLFWELETQN
ncbi:hypothetical protein TNIN_93071 [Trichonephila inaurata madagascariensis]|uniref:Uncharacterized protein n=1 Tax=Trichonephila inaurata madagascariensis TaxID=2747483 RepID=A0A8X6YII8_9ARAC|nr:hypothetical protein TNIN_93071 [Trichonephila inaurata madagascariensis]